MTPGRSAALALPCHHLLLRRLRRLRLRWRLMTLDQLRRWPESRHQLASRLHPCALSVERHALHAAWLQQQMLNFLGQPLQWPLGLVEVVLPKLLLKWLLLLRLLQQLEVVLGYVPPLLCAVVAFGWHDEQLHCLWHLLVVLVVWLWLWLCRQLRALVWRTPATLPANECTLQVCPCLCHLHPPRRSQSWYWHPRETP